MRRIGPFTRGSWKWAIGLVPRQQGDRSSAELPGLRQRPLLWRAVDAVLCGGIGLLSDKKPSDVPEPDDAAM